ncbi:hypothetical protein K437DRAFT_168500 [Tilletiaria anomala UBC 951]|uniref:Uncharacterized protein n=1 Tax=Tilletiaria anomala (strain ATCC 24038 / CBS 436.72 / UBC 951) TaxID=1037660 RepID=A0A066VTU4_TILAU|nr:uncharacterized protein K437DRAFT_168500 [Tilletiaria anomala UBC 951]KDN41980.1 hypothetical protein K437DRAFT_168500 [Tilletiaria anomala UBC 951]
MLVQTGVLCRDIRQIWTTKNLFATPYHPLPHPYPKMNAPSFWLASHPIIPHILGQHLCPVSSPPMSRFHLPGKAQSLFHHHNPKHRLDGFDSCLHNRCATAQCIREHAISTTWIQIWARAMCSGVVLKCIAVGARQNGSATGSIVLYYVTLDSPPCASLCLPGALVDIMRRVV